ncbi:MAG: hypothetical protein H0X45_09825, partial [Planctomycetes bacterium]|nr:hypothetical protein [Planctomycetota bacterium]
MCVPEPQPQPEPDLVVDPLPIIRGEVQVLMGKPGPGPVEPEPVEPEALMGDVCIPEELTPVPQPEVEPMMGNVCVPEEIQPEPIAPPAPADPPVR